MQTLRRRPSANQQQLGADEVKQLGVLGRDPGVVPKLGFLLLWVLRGARW